MEHRIFSHLLPRCIFLWLPSMWHGTFIHGIDIEALTCIFMWAKQCESVLRKRKARKKRKAQAYNVQAFSKHPKQSWDKSKRRLLSPGLGRMCVLHSDFRHGMHSVTKADVTSLSKPHVNCPPVTLFLCSPCWALWDLLKQRRRSSLESIVACQLGQGSFFCFAATERGKAGMIGASLPPYSRVRAHLPPAPEWGQEQSSWAVRFPLPTPSGNVLRMPIATCFLHKNLAHRKPSPVSGKFQASDR